MKIIVHALQAYLGSSTRVATPNWRRPVSVPGLIFCPSQDRSENDKGGYDGCDDEHVGDRHGARQAMMLAFGIQMWGLRAGLD
jgi:hypothetical protein